MRKSNMHFKNLKNKVFWQPCVSVTPLKSERVIPVRLTELLQTPDQIIIFYPAGESRLDCRGGCC